MLKTQLKFIVTIVLVLGLSISLQSLLASWQAPEAGPPSDNIARPINIGISEQTKSGNLILGSEFIVAGTSTVQGDLFLDNIRSLSSGVNIDSGNYGMEFNIDADGNGADRYVFKIDGSEVMNIDQAGNITITGSIVGDGSSLTNINWNSIANVPDSLGLGGGGDTYVVAGLTCPGGDVAVEYEHVSKTCTGSELQENYDCENHSGYGYCTGATDCTTGNSSGWTTGPTPYTCLYKSEKLSTYNASCVGTYCDGTVDVTCTSIGSVKCMDPDDFPLYNDLHTVGQCETNSGEVVEVGGDKFCKFSGTSCLPGFNLMTNLTSTSQNTCTGGACPVYLHGTDCTTGSHIFSITPRDTCSYTYRYDANTVSGDPQNCQSSTLSCLANITSVGCY